MKFCAKDGLIKLKDSKGGDVVVTGELGPVVWRLCARAQKRAAVFPKHPHVAEHRQHLTVKEVELRQQRAEDRERREKETEEKRKSEIHITEFWKPFGSTLNFFIAADKE